MVSPRLLARYPVQSLTPQHRSEDFHYLSQASRRFLSPATVAAYPGVSTALQPLGFLLGNNADLIKVWKGLSTLETVLKYYGMSYSDFIAHIMTTELHEARQMVYRLCSRDLRKLELSRLFLRDHTCLIARERAAMNREPIFIETMQDIDKLCAQKPYMPLKALREFAEMIAGMLVGYTSPDALIHLDNTRFAAVAADVLRPYIMGCVDELLYEPQKERLLATLEKYPLSHWTISSHTVPTVKFEGMSQLVKRVLNNAFWVYLGETALKESVEKYPWLAQGDTVLIAATWGIASLSYRNNPLTMPDSLMRGARMAVPGAVVKPVIVGVHEYYQEFAHYAVWREAPKYFPSPYAHPQHTRLERQPLGRPWTVTIEGDGR